MKQKRFNIVSFTGVVLLIAGLGSCKKSLSDFGSTNNNPGATTAPVTSALLSNVLSTMAGYTWDAGGITTVSGLYCQYFSETQYTDISIYNKEKPDWNYYFAASGNSFTTSGALYNLQTIINYNTDKKTAAIAAANGSNADQIAIARILKAYIFSVLTDTWGDIPYSKALLGDNGVVVYDKQQAIYTDLFKELTEAVAQFDGGIAVSGDILFSGDETKWKQFANSLRLLLALHLSKVDAATGKTQFNAALAAPGGVLGAGQSITLAFPGGNFLSPIYQYYDVTKRFDYAVSKTITDWLAANNDPRGKSHIYGTSNIGFPYGLSRNDAVAFANANTKYAQLLKGADSSLPTDAFPIITSGEIFLARAEAAQLGWTGEDPAAMYATGIAESWKLWGVYDATAFANYMASSNIDLSGGSALQKICTQEWVTHFPAGARGWADWRRTGFPVLAPAPAGVYPNIPRRMSYGPNEYSYNPANVAAAGSQYASGGESDSQYGRIWWDVQ
ncbi:MAG TPA: SusD/RagB family nutrient-binding outer membrane lipoprotein [Puia sp.]|uniref:SusD/RagB family nutrient-binding outer membrane lipoprotein n=1 Tax=Puia sp. TaxID=2045100 RepID=UPI002C9BBFCD|nr:SusD/RagB family nutrient-binding outer membrane lipoprotein [Puia sp.]HVU93811.1 SusD/RagB family nutrient-binding outer membrane lipoprotein [Puia sp.]